MASRHLCYSRSVILDVLRAIVSRSPPPPPSIVMRKGYSHPCHATNFITRAPLHHDNSTSLSKRFLHTKQVQPLVQELEVMEVLQELEPERTRERSKDCRRDGHVKKKQPPPWFLPKHYVKSGLKPKRLKNRSAEQYNRGIYYTVLQQQMNKAVKLLKEMEQRKLKPDVSTYTMIINGYSRATDMERAMKWYHRMKRNHIEPDVYTYTSLIDGYMRMADVPHAEMLFRSMMDKGIRPNRVTYNTLMHQSVMQLDMETAVRFWTNLVEAGLRPDVYTYAIMIHGLGMEGQLDKAWRLYDNMVRQQINVNEVVATSLMGMHVKAHDNSHAVQLFRRFFIQEHRPLTAHTRNVLLNALIAGADHPTIQSYYQQYLDYLNLPKDQRTASSPILFEAGAHVVTFTTFMRSFLRRDDLPMVSQVYQDMMARDIKPTTVTYGILMLAHAYIPDPHSCTKILQEIKAAGLAPNAVLYTIVMRAWAKAGNWEETKRTYEEMKAANIQPTKLTMSVLHWGSLQSK
ncbi:TPR-like protein [Lichtheimia hyalospora FSU 10163]|nr:TPR-like protein [Lichtheimia hyalospora FSU 10163]